MPTYDYKCQECGWKFEEIQPMSSEPYAICPKCDGAAKRQLSRNVRLLGLESGRAGYPYHSDAMGVHPDQIPEAQAACQKKGLDTQYDKEGCPIIRSRKHFKKHAEAFGYYARNAGYGDPIPKRISPEKVKNAYRKKGATK